MKSNRIALAVLAGIMTITAAVQAGSADVVTTAAAPTKVSMLNDRDLKVEAVSEAASLELRFSHADRVDYGSPGELTIINSKGYRTHYRPEAYQVVGGKWEPVQVSYRMLGGNRVSMTFQKYNKDVPVVLRRGAVLN